MAVIKMTLRLFYTLSGFVLVMVMNIIAQVWL